MKFHLRKVVQYAHLHPDWIQRAMDEFFEKIDVQAYDQNIQESIYAFFSEWLIFEFTTPNTRSVITNYFSDDPDNLPKSELHEIQQVIESQRYDFLQINEVKRGEWIDTYGLTTGKKYKIYDHAGSMTAPSEGVMPGRVARIGRQWKLVGCDTFVLPISYTNRAKKNMFEADQNSITSCKDALSLFLSSQNENNSRFQKYTSKQIKNKRNKIIKKYQKLANRYKCSVPFEKLEQFVYHENYITNFADSFTDIIRLGLPPQMVMEETELLTDLWNFFPHKNRNGKCPVELFQEADFS